MKNLIRLSDFTAADIYEIFKLADELEAGAHSDFMDGRTAVIFFPYASIRTRIAFERGIYLARGQSVLFPPDALDKRESLVDVCGYLANCADILIVRHKSPEVIETLARHSAIPVINAMSDENHPCEIISDLYALSRLREDFLSDKYLFCGAGGNIGLTWRDAADVMGFELSQCCAAGYEMGGVLTYHNVREAIHGKDIVCTDALPTDAPEGFKDFQITAEMMSLANDGALLNPCPPFYRGEEVSEDAIASHYFVGYGFKKPLLRVQQAIMLYCMEA